MGTTHARAARAGAKGAWRYRATDVLTHRHGARGKAKEQVRRVELNQQDIDNDVLVHTFEKIETAEEFCGVTHPRWGG